MDAHISALVTNAALDDLYRADSDQDKLKMIISAVFYLGYGYGLQQGRHDMDPNNIG